MLPGSVILERCLLSDGLLTYPYMVLLSAFLVYIIVRLHKSTLLPWQHALLTISLHPTAVLCNADCLKPRLILLGTHPSALAVFNFVAVWMLCAYLTQIVWFEKRDTLSTQQVGKVTKTDSMYMYVQLTDKYTPFLENCLWCMYAYRVTAK